MKISDKQIIGLLTIARNYVQLELKARSSINGLPNFTVIPVVELIKEIENQQSDELVERSDD